MSSAIMIVHAVALAAALGQLPERGAAPSGAARGKGLDPFLPVSLEGAVRSASDAELDPKRGPGNALEILKAEKEKRKTSPEEALSLDLRIAATTLRSRFLSSGEFGEPERHIQALSTFSRLDLEEPGLSRWLEKALDKNPEARRKLGKKSTWTLRVAFLTRSSAIDKGAAAQTFAAAFQRAGVRLVVVPAREAPVVLTLSADEMPREAEGDRAVKVSLGIESIRDGKVTWRHSLFRTEAADSPEVALRSGLAWLARVGGRDLFFRWLGESAFPALLDPTPHAHVPSESAHPSHPGDNRP